MLDDDVADPVAHATQDAERLGLIGPPDVASRTRRRPPLSCRASVSRSVRASRAAPDQVKPQRLDRATNASTGSASPRSPKYAATNRRGRSASPPRRSYASADRRQFGARAVGDERGFVELHPVDTLGGADPPAVARRRRARRPAGPAARSRRSCPRRALRQQEERDRPEQHRARGQARAPAPRGPRPPACGRSAGTRSSRPDLRHDVVVVGVEPLRHPQRRPFVGAARHREVDVEGAASPPAPPGSDRAPHRAGRPCRARGRRRRRCWTAARAANDRPAAARSSRAARARSRSRSSPRRLTVPVGLQSAFEFPARPDPWIAEDGRGTEPAPSSRCGEGGWYEAVGTLAPFDEASDHPARAALLSHDRFAAAYRWAVHPAGPRYGDTGLWTPVAGLREIGCFVLVAQHLSFSSAAADAGHVPAGGQPGRCPAGARRWVCACSSGPAGRYSSPTPARCSCPRRGAA